MCDDVLLQSRRGHTASDTENAAKVIKNAGISLILQMMTGLPGEPPAQTVLRRTDGLMRAAAVGPELGGVIGACDGELPLGVIIAAVADIAGTDPGTMGNETLPVFRDLLARTWLTPVP